MVYRATIGYYNDCIKDNNKTDYEHTIICAPSFAEAMKQIEEFYSCDLASIDMEVIADTPFPIITDSSIFLKTCYNIMNIEDCGSR